MENFYLLFRNLTGKNLLKRAADYKSEDEIDETLFEAVSRLFFEDRKNFCYLKEKALEAAKNEKKDALIFSAAGYFCYVDCDFKKARDFFRKAIELNPNDLEPWLCLAFCLRQLGNEGSFNNIVMHYDNIIKDFIDEKIDINKLSNKNT